jgi:hypothetical protein
MTEEFDDYFRTVKTPEGWEFQVRQIDWENTYEPMSKWSVFRRWRTAPDEARQNKARSAAFRQPRYFQTCVLCNELNASGRMISNRICMSCAENKLGYVF